jgi:CubicO group peptidase (beta-lactamase class C family)
MPPRRSRVARLARVAIVALLAAGCGRSAAPAAPCPAVAPAPGGPRPDPAVLDAHVRRAMAEWEVPGLAIAVVHGDSLWFARGYGVRERGRPEPADPHTLFGLLSPTKTFTAAALALLVEEGRIGWDDPIVEHLPAFRLGDEARTRALTIRDVLSHRSGYPDDHRIWYGRDHGRDEVLRRIATLEPAAPPRTGMHYNNALYLAAGQVVEAVTGSAWDDVVRERFFGPLGMGESTTSHRPLARHPNAARPHARRVFNRVGPPRPIPYRSLDNIGPAGSIHTSVAEVAGWLRLHLNEGVVDGRRLLAPESVRELQRPHVAIPWGDPLLGGDRAFAPLCGVAEELGTGLGWFTMKYRGQRALFHGGGIDGQRSAVGLLPEQGVGVVVLSNLQGTEIALALLHQVFDLFLGAEPRDWSGAYLRQ